MKKSLKIIIPILIVLLLCILTIKFIPFGSTNYKNDDMQSSLTIPKLSTFKEECCMFSSTFKSFRSTYILKKELDSIMKKYDKKICNSKTYYYDKENDITITEYGVKFGFIMNSFYIVYDKGNTAEDACKTVKETAELNEIDGVTMTIKEGTLTNKSTTVIITDINKKKDVYGIAFRIDEKINGKWQEVKSIHDDYGFTEMGYLIDNKGKLEFEQNWDYMYGELSAGEYRLVKSSYDQKEKKDKYFSVEFILE